MEKPYVVNEGVVDGEPFVEVRGIGNFSVFKTFDCGQCFRFDPTDPRRGGYAVSGVALGRSVSFEQTDDGTLTVFGAAADDFLKIWLSYLSLDTDYDAIDEAVTTALDPDGCAVMRRAAEAGRGIRILRQDPWEALCSFIVSQNNNIPRIKKIIAALCDKYGEDTADGKGKAFPTARALAGAGEDAIFALRTGFRAKYISDAARRVASGDVSLERVAEMPTPEAEAELCRIKGVGPKVASCALLFGFGRGDAFPIDVWVRRVLDEYYPDGLDVAALGQNAGIAQQYLFYYKRYCERK